MSVRILRGDVREKLAELPYASVHCVVTSPPYWGLRSYLPSDHHDKAREIGQERLLDCLGWARGENCGSCYMCTIRGIAAQIWRVLRDDGTFWINQGDSYHNGDKGGYLNGRVVNSPIQAHSLANDFVGAANRQPQPGLKPKDLCAQPWRMALALQADGWYWRDEIIWHKKSCMPSSQRDRCTRSHEVVLMFSKSERYYYDIEAIKEPCTTDDLDPPNGSEASLRRGEPSPQQGARIKEAKRSGNKQRKLGDERGRPDSHLGASIPWEGYTRTKRSVWSLGPEPFKESHFATFPTSLVEPIILAGCPPGGVVLDPFGGAGTTGLVADRHGRDAVLIELNSQYADIAERRIKGDSPLFAEVA